MLARGGGSVTLGALARPRGDVQVAPRDHRSPHRVDRRARNLLPRLSGRERRARRLRALARGVRTGRRALPPLRCSPGRNARHRWTVNGSVRALSKVELLRPPTSDAHLATMRAHVRADAKDRPGVYRMLSADGEIVYVGKSKKVRTRLLSYFRCAFPEEKGT